MADIQAGIQFFNDEQSLAMRESVEANQKYRESGEPNAMALPNPVNMSFSFAVEAPVEMKQKQNLIGQGWKKADSSMSPPKAYKKRDLKQSEKKSLIMENPNNLINE